LYNTFRVFGPPLVLHSDNGREFVNQVVRATVSLWPIIKSVYGRPRYPQCQGLVERGNGIFETKLASWMRETRRVDWSQGLIDIVCEYLLN
jgi:hypothetical protein